VVLWQRGIYNLIQPEMAGDLLKRKLRHIRATGASVVATANPGCLLQIMNGARQENLPLRLAHPITLLAEAYGGRSERRCASGQCLELAAGRRQNSRARRPRCVAQPSRLRVCGASRPVFFSGWHKIRTMTNYR